MSTIAMKTGPVSGENTDAARALRIGFQRVLGQPRLVLWLWMLSLGLALLATLPVRAGLNALIATRPAADAIARGQADVLLLEFLADQRVFTGGAMAAAVTAFCAMWLIHIFLSGGLVSALRRPGHPRRAAAGQILACAAATRGAMLRLEAVAILLVRVPILMLAGLLFYLLSRGIELEALPPASLALRLGPAVLVSLWMWSAGTVTIHIARLIRLDQPALAQSATRAVIRALSFVQRAPGASRATLGLALLSLVSLAVLVVVGRILAARLDYRLAAAFALVVRQLFALGRTGLSLAVLAASVEVFESRSKPAL